MVPKINIKFLENVANAVKLTPKGHVVLIIKDNTLQDPIKVFKKLTDVEGVEETNLPYLKDVFGGGASKLTVINATRTTNINGAIKLLDTVKANYVGVLSDTPGDHQALSTYIKAEAKKGRTLKGATFNVNTQNDKHLINLVNAKITFKDTRGEKGGAYVIPYILGVLAGMPLTRGATNFLLGDLLKVENVADIEAEVKKGNLVLNYDGEKVKIVAGVNSLTEVDRDNSEAMKSIVVVEAMDLIKDDLEENFKLYIGGYKNRHEIQMMIIASLDAYFKQLERLEVLDSEYDNRVELDVEAMRIYWQGKGKNVDKISDGEIKTRTCGKNVYLKAYIKILEVIENFELQVFIEV